MIGHVMMLLSRDTSDNQKNNAKNRASINFTWSQTGTPSPKKLLAEIARLKTLSLRA